MTTLPYATMSVLPIRALLDAAATLGIETGRALAEANVERSRIDDDLGRITYPEVYAVVRALEVQGGDTSVALATAERAMHLGLIETLVTTCPTLRDASRLTTEMMRLIADGTTLSLREAPRESVYELTPHLGHPMPGMMAELSLALIVRICRKLLNRELRVSEVRFVHARTKDASRLEAFFGCPVRFEAPAIELAFPTIYLDLPVVAPPPARDEERVQEAEKARRIVAGLPDASILSAVRAQIASHVERGVDVQIGQVARALGLLPRTLQRRLAAAGTTFQTELDALRRELGMERALVAKSVSELAASLGFRDVSAFCRAFRRWTGESPQRYRERRTARASWHALRDGRPRAQVAS